MVGSLLAAFILATVSRDVLAWQTGQHRNITSVAVSKASTDCADIRKFGKTISNWSGGIGNASQNSGIFSAPYAALFGGKPAEELAHLENQTLSMDLTATVDGGKFDDIVKKIQSAFDGATFARETQIPGDVGAYVWMGAAVHLIEDQASPPHAANVQHKLDDHFEGPVVYRGNKPSPIDSDLLQLLSVPFVGAYSACLQDTQNTIGVSGDQTVGVNSAGGFIPYWVPNMTLAALYPTSGYSPNVYTGILPYPVSYPAGSSFFGAYGGILESPPLSANSAWFSGAPADLYPALSGSAGEEEYLYVKQGEQAANYVYTFLEKLSRSLPPLVSELSVGGAVAGTPVINSQSGSPISFRISENRSQAVTVSVYVQDTAQSIITNGDDVTLSSARSVDGKMESTPLPGPNTWNSMQVSLWETLNDGSAAALQLLPFDSNLQLNWNDQVVGAPLTDGAHTLCITVAPYPTDQYSNPSDPLCQSVYVDRSSPTVTALLTYRAPQKLDHSLSW